MTLSTVDRISTSPKLRAAAISRIGAGVVGGANTWAKGGTTGTYRTANKLEGVRSTSGFVTFNTANSKPIGLQTLGINWDYVNLAFFTTTSSFEIVTRGTNNPTPILHYDGFPANRFNNYSSSAVGFNAKEDLLHTWSNPTGGPFIGGLHVGLEQDVWDWTVVSAQVVDPVGARTNAPLCEFSHLESNDHRRRRGLGSRRRWN